MQRINIRPCAIRGRGRSNIQRLEPRNDGICNAITTVQKDSMYIGKVIKVETRTKKMKPIKHLSRKHEKIIDLWNRQYIRERYCSKSEIDKYLFKDFGIFKLTARECLRLQGVAENDIDAMASVNSQSQLYKQAGNSITVSVLCAVFSQLGIKGVNKWNDMSFEERNEVARKGIKLFEDSETELAKKYRATLELNRLQSKAT